MELRINTKGVGGKLPNFGFVVFDDSDPVQRILGAKVEGARIDFFFITPLSFIWWWFGGTFTGIWLFLKTSNVFSDTLYKNIFETCIDQ